MKKNDFDQFKLSLNLNIEIDSNLRRITEKIKLLSQLRDTASLTNVSAFLGQVDRDIDTLISENLSNDEE